MSTVVQMPQPGDIKAIIASEVKALMGRYDVSQVALANHLGISQSQMSKRLRGQITIDVVELDKIARYFGVTAADLVGGQGVNAGPNGPGGVPDTGEYSDAGFSRVLALVA